MKKAALKYSRKFVIFTILWMLIFSIITIPILYESIHYLRAKKIDNLELVIATLQKHPYIVINKGTLTYTNIDIVLEVGKRKVTYHGYELNLNNKKLLLFRKENVGKHEALILKPSTFSTGNNVQFQETWFADYLIEGSINQSEAKAMFVDGVYLDVMGDIKSKLPWSIFSFVYWVIVSVAFGIVMWHVYHIKRTSGPYTKLDKQDFEPINKKLWMSKKEFVVFNKGIKILPFDTIMNVMQKEDELYIYFPKYVLQVKASTATIKHLYRHLYPEILVS